VAELIRELQDFGCNVLVHDPIADMEEAKHEYGLSLIGWDEVPSGVDAIVAAVSHREYLAMGVESLLGKLKPGGVFCDVKAAYDRDVLARSGAVVWRL
jgi:UDP-N-acetyl-D-galactosamine dehydrogenase